MNYAVKFHKDAIKYIEKLDKPTRNRIIDQSSFFLKILGIMN